MRTKIINGYLSDVTINDKEFILKLFADHKVQKYFVLTPEHQRDLELFVHFLLESTIKKEAIYCVIYHEFDEKIGLITAELYRDTNSGNILWNISYAIAPQWRNAGYATSALSGFTEYLESNFSQKVSLDIANSNIESIAVATKCGYAKPTEVDKRVAYLSPEYLELGIRFKWYKKEASQRIALFKDAVHAYNTKNYQSSIKMYTQALQEDYIERTPFTDAQLLSNLGMAYSAVGDYLTAYECLMKAKSLGLTNSQIEKELLWIKEYKCL